MTHLSKIETQILRLLPHNPYVILPGVGAFYLIREEEENRIKQDRFIHLRFNEQLQTNDGLLAQTLMDTCGLTEEAALREVFQYVNRIYESLNGTSRFPFSVLGILESDSRGVLRFKESSELKNYVHGFSGKTAREFSEIGHGIQKPPLKEKGKVSNRLLNLNRFGINNKLKKVFHNINLAGTVNPKAYKYAGLVIAGLFLLSSVYYYVIVKKHNPESSLSLKTDIPENIWDRINLTNAEQPSAGMENKTIAGDRQNVSDTKYFLVTGSFAERVNAEQLADELGKKGYDVSIIAPFNGGILYRVVLEPFTSLKEALKKKEDLAEEIKNIWIMNLNLKNVFN